ncbi:MAG: flagellar hook-length control protein FliK, partial [Vulcanimicrobiota bacterium]
SGNQVSLQLLKTLTFARVSQSDLSQALTSMKLPVNEKSMAIAKGLVEFQLPLTPKNVQDFTRLMSSLPRPMTPTDMAAASFLKMARLPMTPANVKLLSSFIAKHPMLGEQLFSIQKDPGAEATTKETSDREVMLEDIRGNLRNYIVDPRKQQREAMAKNLRNLAGEEGIEKLEYNGFGGSDLEDSWQLMKLTRQLQNLPLEGLSREEAANRQKALGLLKEMGENLGAHQLINRGKIVESDLAFYYFQVPFKLNDEETTVEIRIKYHNEEDEKVVDPENTHIEFDVTTENLGDMHVDLKVRNAVVSLEINNWSGELAEFMERFIPSLRQNIKNMGYKPGLFKTGVLDEMQRRGLISKLDMDSMEKIDVQA